MENSISHQKAVETKTAKVFSVPAGCRFLDVFVRSLLAGEIVPGFVPGEDSLLLPTATIFVPNRRTARALALAFLDAPGPQARLLPSIKTLGDVEDDHFGLPEELDDLETDLQVVGLLERQLELAKLIQKWVDALSEQTRCLYEDEEIFIPSSQAGAVRLAADLCGLLDQITQEETNWAAISDIVPDEHAQWWSITSTFLKIIMEHWPAMLADQQLVDPAMRARLMIDRRIEKYKKAGSKGPVIIAGSTGSVPSTRRLLQTVSELPNGAVVLPGLDKSIPVQEWAMLSGKAANPDNALESHPQFGLANLLADIGIDRESVLELGQSTDELSVRGKITSSALSLPIFTGQWNAISAAYTSDDLAGAFGNVSLIEAVNERQEALAIAVAFRETLETPERTAALVTPDRNLARRVAIELKRYDIDVDDSSGQPLNNTPSGLFIRQLVRFCFGFGSNSELAELLKSPFFRIGLSQARARQTGEAIEMRGLRGAIGSPSCGEIHGFLKGRKERSYQPSSVVAADSDGLGWEDILQHARSIDDITQPVRTLTEAGEPVLLGTYVAHLSEMLAALGADENGNNALGHAPGTAEVTALFGEITLSDAAGFEITPLDFPSVFDALIDGRTVRQSVVTHPRLHIYGPLEIRLLDHDRVIMAGLNEGTWPQATRNDAFLNRTMRQQLGMASPERRTGLSAHDFQQIMGKRDVVLSRSLRVDKAPTIASRWVQRLGALLGEQTMNGIRDRGRRYVSYAVLLDETGTTAKRQQRPEPAPPLETRPTALPVTDIETWIRDPYALYAKRILKLRPLEPLERTPDHRLKGVLYHSILEAYVSLDCLKLPVDERFEKLVAIARDKIADERLEPEVELVWQFRFEEIAKQFVAWEQEYKQSRHLRDLQKEVKGEVFLSEHNFRLFARADRIDVMDDGSLLVLDYKTGSSPSPKQARTLSPQLVLEGLIAREGGFENTGQPASVDLAFIRLRQGKGFGLQSIADRKDSVETLIERGKTNLEQLVVRYQDEKAGYVSRRAPFRDGDISGDYDHLARTREWSFGEEGEEG